MDVDYHQLANFIGEALPGKGVWLHSAPTEEVTAEETISEDNEESGETALSQYPLAEGIAIRVFLRDDVQTEGTTFWSVFYFSIWSTLPTQPRAEEIDAKRDARTEPEELEDLSLRIGFNQEYDTLGEAKTEARELVEYLPVPDSVDREANRRMHNMLFAAIDDLQD